MSLRRTMRAAVLSHLSGCCILAESQTEGRKMEVIESVKQSLGETEHLLLAELRLLRRKHRDASAGRPRIQLTIGQRIADIVASNMGSWRFIIIQSCILVVWIALNITAYVERWDPYPFILLNLALSFQAAYAAPFIMMSQNRQQDVDRLAAEHDYQINIKAELEIELLHEKIDKLREQEVVQLTQAVADLTEMLKRERGASDRDTNG